MAANLCNRLHISLLSLLFTFVKKSEHFEPQDFILHHSIRKTKRSCRYISNFFDFVLRNLKMGIF